MKTWESLYLEAKRALERISKLGYKPAAAREQGIADEALRYCEQVERYVGAESDLALKFAYFTECQLATVEHLRGLSRAAKHELKRHENIADHMVRVCAENCITGEQPNGSGCPRLKKRLAEAKTPTT
jgi:hypothetical protein